jgi:hypothetical protein
LTLKLALALSLKLRLQIGLLLVLVLVLILTGIVVLLWLVATHNELLFAREHRHHFGDR